MIEVCFYKLPIFYFIEVEVIYLKVKEIKVLIDIECTSKSNSTDNLFIWEPLHLVNSFYLFHCVTEQAGRICFLIDIRYWFFDSAITFVWKNCEWERLAIVVNWVQV